jgi:hypothetical protein
MVSRVFILKVHVDFRGEPLFQRTLTFSQLGLAVTPPLPLVLYYREIFISWEPIHIFYNFHSDEVLVEEERQRPVLAALLPGDSESELSEHGV